MESFEELISKAEAGDVQSCFELGQRCALGEGVDASESAAFGWYIRAAKMGHPGAQFVVGHCYAYGLTVPVDAMEGCMWMFRASMGGNAEAYRWLSDYYQSHETPKDSVLYDYFKQRSGPEDPDATFMLAKLKELAVGTEFDPAGACADYNEAAKSGHYAARLMAATCVLNGMGTARDRSRGAGLLQELADDGYAPAAISLGRCYEYGYGVDRDRSKAFAIYRELAEFGNDAGMYSLGRCYMDGVGVDKDGPMAYAWYSAAAGRGSIAAIYGLARCHIGGVGTEKNRDLGLKLLEEAASFGQTDAMVMLGQLNARGKQVKKNTQASASWFKKAADLGDGYAQLITGDNYSNGTGLKKDSKLAMRYYLMSAAHGNDVACFNAIEPMYDESPDILNAKIVEYAMASIKGKDSFHITVICDVSPFCDCHGENDMPVVPNVGILASYDPVALDRACIDLVQKQQMIPGSLLWNNCDGRKPSDVFKCVQPSTRWQSTFEHAERMGFGSSDYELIEVR